MAFEKLFNKSVPHILERIFFSLDYDSFMACRAVSKTWNELLSTEQYRNKSLEMLLMKQMNGAKLWKLLREGNAREVSELVSTTGVALNCESPQELGLTPLLFAVTHKQTDVARVLLKAGADPNRALQGLNSIESQQTFQQDFQQSF